MSIMLENDIRGNLCGLTSMLEDAQTGHYAVGAFNFCNAESLQAIIEEGSGLRSPIMLIIGPWEIPLIGARLLVKMVNAMASEYDVRVCLHLDHACDIVLVEECIKAGFPSVMIDASQHSFEENVRMTRHVVDIAHPLGITVEGELGAVGRVDDSVVEGAHESSLTDPDMASEFVRRTGVDALAVAIGNAHGMYTQRPELDFDRLLAIRDVTQVPLVLHGGSGTPLEQLRRSIDIGISKVNVASEISKAYMNTLHDAIVRTEGKVWYGHALVESKNAIKSVVNRWMHQLGSVGRL